MIEFLLIVIGLVVLYLFYKFTFKSKRFQDKIDSERSTYNEYGDGSNNEMFSGLGDGGGGD